MDADTIAALPRLLHLPTATRSLQRLLGNLCANSAARDDTLRLLVATLKSPLSADEAAVAGASQASSALGLLEASAVLLFAALYI
jgi:hypothetical protein